MRPWGAFLPKTYLNKHICAPPYKCGGYSYVSPENSVPVTIDPNILIGTQAPGSAWLYEARICEDWFRKDNHQHNIRHSRFQKTPQIHITAGFLEF